jgi:hypothetical protein
MSAVKHEQLEFLKIFRYAKEKGFVKRKRKTPMESKSSSETCFRLMYDILKSIAINKNIFKRINRNGYYILFHFNDDISGLLNKCLYMRDCSSDLHNRKKLYSDFNSLRQELTDIGGNIYHPYLEIHNLNYFKFKLFIEFIDRLEPFCNNSLELLKEVEKEAEIEKQNKLKELNKEINQKHNIVIPEAETETQRKFNLALAKYLENSNGPRQ